MLVIISDLHLTDGSSGATISAGAFEIFAERLRQLALGASWRADGRYEPIRQIDLLLLGDVLDVIRSSRWSRETPVRPWTDHTRHEFFDAVTRITGDILRNNAESLRILRSLATDGAISVPPANGRGRPAQTTELLPVPVRIHYMVGNHDWFFHLPGERYNLLREAVVRHLGLANAHDEPFPHDPVESEPLLEVMRRHKVLARHGDRFDPFNYEGDRDASSLGDAIVIELLNRFAVEVESQMADDLPAATLLGLRELDNVRPLVLAPVWIDGLLERTCPFPAVRKQVKLIWDQLADEFLDQPFVRSRDTWNPTDSIDALEWVLKFSKGVSIGWASRVLTWLNGLRGQQDGSYYSHALAEADFRNRRAKHVVYGHTHHVESVPLDASYAEGYVHNQLYFNSGTWRRVHQQTQLAPSEREFIASDVMTYLAFFQGDERSGRPFETWSGMLGVSLTEEPLRRIDAARSADVPDPAHTRAPTLHRPTPHFRLAADQSPIVPTRRV